MGFDYKAAAKKLVSQMTLDEKIGQMLHAAPAIERLGIPAYNWWNEALHGVARAGTATVYPQAIGLAAAFDTDLLEEIGDAVANEGRAKYNAFAAEGDRDIYKGLTFWSPNINIFRDPRWGRGHETYGEDPHLTSELGKTYIKALQGGENPEQLKVAACAKHFAVHSGPESVRHEFDAVCDDYDLWNTYLYAFDDAVNEAHVAGVMGAYNRTNGEVCCGSQKLLVDILREKWGFDGYVTSDCWAIKDFHEHHGVTANPTESVALAINKTCDTNCGNLYGYALAAVKEGLLSVEKIDESCARLMEIRMRLGLLDAPEVAEYVNIPYDVIDSKSYAALSQRAAEEGIVLLKNDGVLPLATGKTIGVIGPNANSRAALVGNYEGTASRYVTVLEGIGDEAEKTGGRVLYAEGCHLFKNRVSGLSLPDDRIAEAVAVAKHSDVVVLALGLDASLEGEEGDTGNEFSSGDKNNLSLPGRQQYLLEKIVAVGKPVILVLLSGSALAVPFADEHCGAVLQAFYPGARGGTALANILFGKVSPSGKLPVTFYKDTASLPEFTDYNMANRTYRYFDGEVLYPFGFGLTYSAFDLSGFSANKSGAEITIKNTGKTDAAQVIQIYASSDKLKERKSLIAFKKVFLKAGESKRVSLEFGRHAFARYDANGDLYAVEGAFTLTAGFDSADNRLQTTV